MNDVNEVSNTDTCSYLNHARVALLATDASEVGLRVGSGFGAWADTAYSTNGLAVSALLSPTGNWHNGATWDNWAWSQPGSDCTALCNDGWPNMYHSCGDGNGVHWMVGDGHDKFSTRTFETTTTWLR